MSSLGKNIEALTSKSCIDMWDRIYMSQAPKFITFSEGASFRIRIIGDIVTASRHYIPSEAALDGFLSKEELEAIVRGNETIYNNSIDKLFSTLDEKLRNVVTKYRVEDQRSTSEAKSFLARTQISDADALCIRRIKEIDSLFASSNWARCYLSNVMIREQQNARNSTQAGAIAILPITNQILEGIFTSAKTLYGDKIHAMKMGGLAAHDIHISRANQGNNRSNRQGFINNNQRPSYQRYTWMVNLSPHVDSLTQPEVATILKYGVYDLHEAAKHVNRGTAMKKSGFLYKVNKIMMNNKQMVGTIIDEYDDIESEQQAQLIDKNLNNLPDSAFSNRQAQGAIGSLEL